MILLILLFLTSQVLCESPMRHKYNSTTCDDFQANFHVSKVTGAWHVVAIIPDNLFPDREVNCYKVEFAETDGASLRWLVKKTKAAKEVLPKLENIKGTTIRQRYYTEQPFDVWSKSVEAANGCFEQVLSLDADLNDTQSAATHDAMMQLHFIESVNKNAEPFLVQMLWGRLIAAVVYKRKAGVTQEELKPVFEFLYKLRGPQRLPKICSNPLRDLLFF